MSAHCKAAEFVSITRKYETIATYCERVVEVSLHHDRSVTKYTEINNFKRNIHPPVS